MVITSIRSIHKLGYNICKYGDIRIYIIYLIIYIYIYNIIYIYYIYIYIYYIYIYIILYIYYLTWYKPLASGTAAPYAERAFFKMGSHGWWPNAAPRFHPWRLHRMPWLMIGWGIICRPSSWVDWKMSSVELSKEVLKWTNFQITWTLL